MLAYAVVTAEAGETTGVSIWSVAADDRDLRRLTPEGLDAGDPAWSPDGTRILFTTKPVHAYYAIGPRPIDEMRMYTMAPDGSDIRRLALPTRSVLRHGRRMAPRSCSPGSSTPGSGPSRCPPDGHGRRRRQRARARPELGLLQLVCHPASHP